MATFISFRITRVECYILCANEFCFIREKLTSSKEMGTSSRDTDTSFPLCCWSCPAPLQKPGRGGMNGEEAKEEEEDLEEGGVEAPGLGLPLGLGAVGGGVCFGLGATGGGSLREVVCGEEAWL